MKTLLGLVATLTLLVVCPAQTSKKPTVLSCPVCHMPLSSKKTAADPVAVKLTKKGKTYYCCSKCKMPASVIVKK